MLYTISVKLYMNLVQYNEWLISIVDADGLVLWHQGISSHSPDYAPVRFPVFGD